MKGDRLYFVQLMHPGGEHRADGGHKKTWNRLRTEHGQPNKHRRTFLQCPGAYVYDGLPVESELVFWGEWEPEALVLHRLPTLEEGHPRFIFQPYYEKPNRYVGLHNTDPFVFGGFYYTFCYQKGNSLTKHMSQGSVVLFGSHRRGQFFLDTVLVVKNFLDHDKVAWRMELKSRVPEAYKDVTLEPGYASGQASYRLYFGATYSDPYEGMYSFFPCLTAGQQPKSFARPKIVLPGFVSSGLRMNFKAEAIDSITEARDIWEAVREQVIQQGLAIGIGAQIPERKGEHIGAL